MCDLRDVSYLIEDRYQVKLLNRPDEVSIFPVRPEVALPTIPRYRGKGQRRRKGASIRTACPVLSRANGQLERWIFHQAASILKKQLGLCSFASTQQGIRKNCLRANGETPNIATGRITKQPFAGRKPLPQPAVRQAQRPFRCPPHVQSRRPRGT